MTISHLHLFITHGTGKFQEKIKKNYLKLKSLIFLNLNTSGMACWTRMADAMPSPKRSMCEKYGIDGILRFFVRKLRYLIFPSVYGG